MKGARNVARAAWTSQSLRITSWSCIGPRRRQTASASKTDETGTDPSTSTAEAAVEPFLTSNKTAEETIAEIMTAAQIEAAAEDDDIDDGDDEDGVTEAELWQQLESEIYRAGEGEEADAVREIREEEVAAVAEVGGTSESDGLLPAVTTEVHRFFPPGRIIHMVTYNSNEMSREGGGEDADGEFREEKSSNIGVFETPRSLYGKLRLSQAMINDHYMPIYRRNMERLIDEIVKEEASQEECHYKDRSL